LLSIDALSGSIVWPKTTGKGYKEGRQSERSRIEAHKQVKMDNKDKGKEVKVFNV